MVHYSSGVSRGVSFDYYMVFSLQSTKDVTNYIRIYLKDIETTIFNSWQYHKLNWEQNEEDAEKKKKQCRIVLPPAIFCCIV